MTRSRFVSPMLIAVVVAIGCGGSKPQDAAATTNSHTSHAESSAPMQLAEAPTTTAAAGSGTIQVMVKLDGTAPKPEAIKMNADPVCQQKHPTPAYSEAVVVNDTGMLKNVFVYVKEGAKGPFEAPTKSVTLDQNGCWYQPHVFGIQVNQSLDIVNSDPTLHNINAKPTKNQPFNVAQPMPMKTTKKFTQPEVMVKFKCNVHPWMNAYAGVVENPYFGTTDQSGAASISGLPAGTYTLEAWHEKFGTQTQTVTLGSGETKSVQFTFKVQAAPAQ